jgi:hypothetical protein
MKPERRPTHQLPALESQFRQPPNSVTSIADSSARGFANEACLPLTARQFSVTGRTFRTLAQHSTDAPAATAGPAPVPSAEAAERERL